MNSAKTRRSFRCFDPAPAVLAESVHSGRDVDPLAENVAAFNHNVAKVYADPVDDALGLRQGLW